ncbi:hypothetical protein KR222_001716, partial [Zaprionus bogoriensis]
YHIYSFFLLLALLSLSTLDALPWSPSDPMEPALFQLYKSQKQRNLAKIQLLPQNAISFVGPRQATSSEVDEEAYYDGDEYDDESG